MNALLLWSLLCFLFVLLIVKSKKYGILVYWVKHPVVMKESTKKMTSLTWGGGGKPKDDIC